MGPGKYDPKIDLITKNQPKIKMILSQPTNENAFEMKLKKVFNKAAIDGEKNLNYSEILELNIKNKKDLTSMIDISSIEKTITKNVKKGENASFVSTTNRIKHESTVPGPGSYNLNSEHKILKNKFDSFGTTAERSTEFNRNISLPFTDPTYMTSPPVGHYLGKSGGKNI